MSTSTARLVDGSWQDVAAAQDAVLRRGQALAGGMSDKQWCGRLRSGRWQSVLPGVAVLHSGPVTSRQRSWSAVLYAGRGACLSGDAALVELGMQLAAPSVVDIAVAHDRAVRPQRFRDAAEVRVAVHRLLGLDGCRHPVRTPPSVRPAPAVLHAAAWATSDRAAEWRVAAAVQQRLVVVPDLRTALVTMPRLPRRALLRRVLDDVELGAHAAGELDFVRFLRRHRLPPPDRLQRPVRAGQVRYLDAWWERQRVTVELDGAHHRSVAAWGQDVLRANDVVVAERQQRIIALRFTTGQLRHDAERVAAQLKAVLL